MKRTILPVDSLARGFRLLRNRIEAEIQSPALLFVTSATAGDGAGFAAHGLAESLSRTHQRTVLITSNPALAKDPELSPGERRRRASDRLDAGGAAAQSGSFSVVCISPERVATISRKRIGEMVLELRKNNDYVVVDAGDLSQNGLGLLLVGSADVTIIAFRSARAQQEADRLMLDTLERAECKILGVIMTDKRTLETFKGVDDRGVPTSEPAAEITKRVPVLKRLEFALSRLVKSN
jgi:Mrp family chromosome partitioning ATPase